MLPLWRNAPILVLAMNVTLVPLCVDFSSAADYFLFTFHVLSGASTVLVAGCVASSIMHTRALLRENRFLFMLNTSISDTLTGCGIFYQFLFDVRVDFPSKNGAFYIIPSLLGVNIMTFLFAQFDRYLAVCHPVFYCRFISTRVVVCVNAYCWVHVYGLLLVQNMVPVRKAVDIAVYARISLLVIIFTKISMTIKLLVVARYQVMREPPGADRDSKKESLLIVVVVVILFLLLWSPSMLYTILSSLIEKRIYMKNDTINPFKMLARSNALCTPRLYLWASPSLRAAVRATWSKVCCSCGKTQQARQKRKIHFFKDISHQKLCRNVRKTCEESFFF